MLPRVLVCLGAFWSFSVAQQRLDLYEGDICKETPGALWTCKARKDCPTDGGLSDGNTVQECNSQGSEPIVCCEPSLKQHTDVGAKTRLMCKKYAEYVYVSGTLDDGDVVKLDTCGFIEPFKRSVRSVGMNTSPMEFPHMALIGYGENNAITWLCGGSLISERYVLSAAHCNDAGPKRGLARWVRLGDYNAKNTDDDEMGLAKTMKYEIIERIIHPEYLRRSVYNDIALYKLEKNVEFNEYVRPICLQTEHQFAKSYVIGAGWDPNERLGKNNGVLQKVNLTITPRKQCSEAYESVKATEKLKSGIDDDSMVCAVDKENADPCLVDAGGPIMIRLTTPYCMYSQVGIASFGTQCSGNRPGVYTRVSRYVPWIESIVWP